MSFECEQKKYTSERERMREGKILSIVMMINKHTIIENMCLLINNILPLILLFLLFNATAFV